MDDLEVLLKIEERFWKSDAEFYRQSMTDDAVMVFPLPAGVLSREPAIEAVGRGPRWSQVRMDNVKAVRLSNEAVLLTYEAHAERAAGRYATLASSAYARRDGAWKLAFHQQTPIEDFKRRG
jgi:hypothetical protein